MPQKSQEQDDQTVELQYFIVGPDKKVYKNPHNLPAKNIQSLDKFKNGLVMRFAFDPTTGDFFVQDDDWRDNIENVDPESWNLLNSAIKYIGEKFGIDQVKKRYGEPPGSASLSHLSDYGIAWNYIENYIKKDFETDAVDLAVIEYAPEEDVKAVVFHEDGFSYGSVSVAEPVLVVNRKAMNGADKTVDYGLVNHRLIFCYLINLRAIAKKSLSQSQYDSFSKTYKEHMNPKKFSLFFAGFSQNGAEVHKANEKQSDRIQNEQSLRQSLRTAKCQDCNTLNDGLADHCSKCNSANLEYGREYTGPLVLFTFLPERKQLVFQNHHPEDMDRGSLKELLDKIKTTISAVYKVPEEELIYSYDPSTMSPFVSMMSRYQVVWDYICNTLCPREGIDPKDIPVYDAPVSMHGGLASFISNEGDENEKTEGGLEYRISYGVSLPYPFIQVTARIQNLGLRYNAMIHEYKHYVDYMKKNLSAMPEKYEDKEMSFLAYIRSPDEQAAHMEQMVHALSMGMRAPDVLNMFAKTDNLLARAEYSKILDKAIEVFNQQRGIKAKPSPKAPEPQQFITHEGGCVKLTRLAKDMDSSQIPALVDWWNMEVGVVNTPLTPSPKDEKKDKATAEGLNALVSMSHDADLGFMKPLEQLLRESRV